EDEDLSNEFNYDDVSAGDLDYFAVAKAGILLFADHIHDQYLSSGWAATTWSWLMGIIGRSGQTLVDIVASIWSLASATIAKVKSVATDVWNGVKAAGQFILNAILTVIHGIIATVLEALIYAILTTLSALTGLTDVIYGSSIDLKQNGNVLVSIDTRYDAKGITLEFNDYDMVIPSPISLSGGPLEFETLSAGYSELLDNIGVGTELLAIWSILMVGIGLIIQVAPPGFASYIAVAGSMLVLTLGGILAEYKLMDQYAGEDKDRFIERTAAIHFGLGLGLLENAIKISNWSANSKIFNAFISLPIIGTLITKSNALLATSAMTTIYSFLKFSSLFFDGAQAAGSIVDIIDDPLQVTIDVAMPFIFGAIGTVFSRIPNMISSGIYKDALSGGKLFSTKIAPKSKIKSYSLPFFILSIIHLVAGIYFNIVTFI
ncbi:MAG: hypothetical protein ACW99Q_14485, partial [Candidatus Kariarchaeaceae archaeon]